MPDIKPDTTAVEKTDEPTTDPAAAKPGLAPSGLKLLARILLSSSSLMTRAAARFATAAEKLEARAEALAAPTPDANSDAEDLTTAAA